MQALRSVARHALRECSSQQSAGISCMYPGRAQSRRACNAVRTYKNLPTHKNPYVEAWYDAREDMELTATITGPMLGKGFFWGLLVPYAVYEGIVTEFNDSARHTGRDFTFMPASVEAEPAAHDTNGGEED